LIPLRFGTVYAVQMRSTGLKVWEKCFIGQKNCLIGLMSRVITLQEYEMVIQSA